MVRLDLNSSGSTYFVVRTETGRGFDNTWNNTGAGLGSAQRTFNVKAIAIHRKLGANFEAEAGGLDFDRGAGTDATCASGDGHMTGYRAVFHGHSRRSPHKIALTAGYLGDFDKPNFLSRPRMDGINYLQLIAEQRFGEQVKSSAELDSIRNVVFARGAMWYRRLWMLEDATLEAGERAIRHQRCPGPRNPGSVADHQGSDRPRYMRGVVNVRGQATPVEDLRLKFGLPENADSVHTRIIVMELELDGEPTVLGGIADAVHEVTSNSNRQHQSASPDRHAVAIRFHPGHGQARRRLHHHSGRQRGVFVRGTRSRRPGVGASRRSRFCITASLSIVVSQAGLPPA